MLQMSKDNKKILSILLVIPSKKRGDGARAECNCYSLILLIPHAAHLDYGDGVKITVASSLPAFLKFQKSRCSRVSDGELLGSAGVSYVLLKKVNSLYHIYKLSIAYCGATILAHGSRDCSHCMMLESSLR